MSKKSEDQEVTIDYPPYNSNSTGYGISTGGGYQNVPNWIPNQTSQTYLPNFIPPQLMTCGGCGSIYPVGTPHMCQATVDSLKSKQMEELEAKVDKIALMLEEIRDCLGLLAIPLTCP